MWPFPKDAGVLLVALGVGLATGSGLIAFAGVASVFVILVPWLLESLASRVRTRFDLTMVSKDSLRIRAHVEHALRANGVSFELSGSSDEELRYEVAVPFDQKIKKLTKVIRQLDGPDTTVDWQIKDLTVRT